ncbi:MAG: helix-turn-helix transcriptional regulator [Oscillospiraceae bacterium]|nr:helix-turn-helix transcriptional regulator [Oscillospiraceae bacterium]
MYSTKICKEFAILFRNITWLRKHYGFSKRKMAKLLGIGVWSLNKIEKGELPPRLGINIVFAVQEHFNVHPTVQLSQLLEQT